MSKSMEKMCELQDMIDTLKTDINVAIVATFENNKVTLETDEHIAEFTKIANAVDYMRGIYTGYQTYKAVAICSCRENN